MIKVYEVSRKYIMLFMHNNRYLPLTGLLTYFVLPEKHCEIFEIFQKYVMKYFMKYFTPKKFMKFYITMCRYSCTLLKSLDGVRCHLAETLMWAYVTLF